jgi:hypothetical protein
MFVSNSHVDIMFNGSPMTKCTTIICGTRCEGAISAHSSDGPSDISGPLLLPPTMMTGSLTSMSRCYCRTRGTREVPTSPNSNNGTSDISGPLLLPSTVVTDYMTSDDRCYCWTRGTHVVATSPHSNDGHSDISGPSTLASTVAMS